MGTQIENFPEVKLNPQAVVRRKLRSFIFEDTLRTRASCI